MEDFKSALLEVVKYQNEQQLKLQENQKQQLLKLLERIEENRNKQQLFQERM